MQDSFQMDTKAYLDTQEIAESLKRALATVLKERPNNGLKITTHSEPYFFRLGQTTLDE